MKVKKSTLKKSVRKTARAQMKDARKTKRSFKKAMRAIDKDPFEGFVGKEQAIKNVKDSFKKKKKTIKAVKKSLLKGVRKGDITEFKK